MSGLSSSSSFANYRTNHPSFAPPTRAATRISCGPVSTRPKKKKTSDQSEEAQELVRLLTRKISTDKEPLLKTLNKYVKLVRTEHCFLLFEELGKYDKWLQCLEVTLSFPSTFAITVAIILGFYKNSTFLFCLMTYEMGENKIELIFS